MLFALWEIGSYKKNWLIYTWFKKKSSYKNQVWQTGFLACKNQFQNWFLQAKNPVCRTWFLQLDFSKIKYRSTDNIPQIRILDMYTNVQLYFKSILFFSGNDKSHPGHFVTPTATPTFCRFASTKFKPRPSDSDEIWVQQYHNCQIMSDVNRLFSTIFDHFW